MKKVLIGVGVLIVVAAVAFTLLVSNLDTLIKKGVETVGPKILQADVKLDKVNLAVSSGSGELLGFRVGNPAGFKTDYAFDMERIKIELDPQSLTTDTIHIRRILIDGPKIIYEGALGQSNLNKLQANAQAYAGKSSNKEETSSGEGKPGKTVIIDLLKIDGGEASLSMNLLQGQKVTVALPTIELKDIGSKKKIGFAGVLKTVLAEINKALVPAIQSKLAELALPGGIQGGGDKIQQGAAKGLDTIKGIFGK